MQVGGRSSLLSNTPQQRFGGLYDDILSESFTAPSDRVAFLEQVQEGQSDRHERRLKQLQALQSLNAANIQSAAVVMFQEECDAIADDEMGAIQACYDRLGELRGGLNDMAKARVEELRKELHMWCSTFEPYA